MSWGAVRSRLRDGTFFGAVRNEVRTGLVRPLRKDLLRDLVELLDHRTVAQVVDVGGHLGSMSQAFLTAFPSAAVLAVEADERSVEALRRRFATEPRFSLAAAAASSRDGATATFHATGSLATSSLLRPKVEASQAVTVPTVTLDAECERRGIGAIDVLKIDVEGAELEVLGGASDLLARGAVGAIVAEARFIAETDGGVLLPDLAVELARTGYRLHNLYDEVESRALGVIYGNALFVGPGLEAELLARWGEGALVHRYGWHR